MTARTDVQAMKGATLGLSATLPATYDAAGYGATAVVYTTVGTIESFGNHGMNATVIKFTPIATGVVAKMKGSKDYGSKQFVLGNIPADTGQVLVATAAESTARYSAKITYPVGNGESTPEIHYLDVLVTTREFQDGDVNSVRKLAVAMELCRAAVEVAAT